MINDINYLNYYLHLGKIGWNIYKVDDLCGKSRDFHQFCITCLKIGQILLGITRYSSRLNESPQNWSMFVANREDLVNFQWNISKLVNLCCKSRGIGQMTWNTSKLMKICCKSHTIIKWYFWSQNLKIN